MKYYSLGIQSPCQMMIGVYNHLLSKVFRFHYHSQKVIGSLGISFGQINCLVFPRRFVLSRRVFKAWTLPKVAFNMVSARGPYVEKGKMGVGGEVRWFRKQNMDGLSRSR